VAGAVGSVAAKPKHPSNSFFNIYTKPRKTIMKNFFQRNIRRIVFGVLATTLVVGGLSACGHHRDHSWGANVTQEQFAEQRDKMVDRAASKLDLNVEQKKLLSVVGDKMFEQRKSMIGQTTDPRAELKSLIAGPKFDTAKAQALITDKTTVMQAKSPETLAALAAFYDSLNATQQQKVRDLMEGHHGWFNRG
jgi:Spy/CpxP family protein refolding chaperone